MTSRDIAFIIFEKFIRVGEDKRLELNSDPLNTMSLIENLINKNLT